jgi:carbonic anhydrase
VARTTIVQDAWARGQPLAIHGWIYGLEDGLLADLGLLLTGQENVDAAHMQVAERLLGA